MIKYLSKFLYVIGDAKRRLPFMLTMFVGASILEALGIGMIGPFLNIVSDPNSVQENKILTWLYQSLQMQSSSQFVLCLALAIGIVFCIKSVIYFFVRVIIFQFSFTVRGKVALELIEAYLKVPYTFYLRRDTASIIKNIVVETQKFVYEVTLPLLRVIANAVVVIVLTALLAQTSSLLLLMVIGIILPALLVFSRFRKKIRIWGKESSESQQEVIQVINHSLGSIKETRVIGCEAYFQQEMQEQTDRFTAALTFYNSFQQVPRIMIETLLILMLLLFVCVYQVFFSNEVKNLIATLSVFTVASIRLIPAASQLVSDLAYLQGSTHSLQMLYADLKEVDQALKQLSAEQSLIQGKGKDKEQRSIAHQPLNFSQQIELKNLTYYYPDTKQPAITEINLKIQKGESIAFIGKSGAGKTTLVDVILGLLQPQSGDICVDGVSIYENVRSWQNLIGYIPQSIFLMNDTIEKNIAFGVPDEQIDTNRLYEVIEATQLTELINQLPSGINTVVGERGVRLSGGQRQRLGIARALYHEREILILDEATSALDNETERLISEAIESLSGTKTVIIIAHRLTTVKNCDYVYLLEHGKLVKSGKFQDVVSDYLNTEAVA